MQPFDDGYMERREKEIQEWFVLRAINRTTALVAIVSTIALIYTTTQGNPLALIFALIASAMWLGTCFTWAVSKAQASAERAIQAEYERLQMLFEISGEKPKRQSITRFSSDGEFIVEEEEHSVSADPNTYSEMNRQADP